MLAILIDGLAAYLVDKFVRRWVFIVPIAIVSGVGSALISSYLLHLYDPSIWTAEVAAERGIVGAFYHPLIVIFFVWLWRRPGLSSSDRANGADPKRPDASSTLEIEGTSRINESRADKKTLKLGMPAWITLSAAAGGAAASAAIFLLVANGSESELLLACDGKTIHNPGLNSTDDLREQLSFSIDGDTVHSSNGHQFRIIRKGGASWSWGRETSDREFGSIFDTISGELRAYQTYVTRYANGEETRVLEIISTYQCRQVDKRVTQ